MDNQNTQTPLPNSSPNPMQAPPPPAPQPSPTPQPIYNLSASQMGLNGPAKKFTFAKLMKPLIIVTAVIVLAGVGWYVLNSQAGYGTRTVQADGFSYSVYFDKRAELQTVQGVTYLSGKDTASGNTMVVSVIKSEQANRDCFENETVKIIAKPIVEGKEHNLCYSGNISIFAMNFTYNDQWYLLTIFPKTSGEKLDQETAKTIANSVKIN